MQNEWLLDVLSDLRSFAVANGMHRLSRQLDLTRDVAVTEMLSCHADAKGLTRTDEDRVGADTGAGSTRIRA